MRPKRTTHCHIKEPGLLSFLQSHSLLLPTLTKSTAQHSSHELTHHSCTLPYACPHNCSHPLSLITLPPTHKPLIGFCSLICTPFYDIFSKLMFLTSCVCHLHPCTPAAYFPHGIYSCTMAQSSSLFFLFLHLSSPCNLLFPLIYSSCKLHSHLVLESLIGCISASPCYYPCLRSS